VRRERCDSSAFATIRNRILRATDGPAVASCEISSAGFSRDASSTRRVCKDMRTSLTWFPILDSLRRVLLEYKTFTHLSAIPTSRIK